MAIARSHEGSNAGVQREVALGKVWWVSLVALVASRGQRHNRDDAVPLLNISPSSCRYSRALTSSLLCSLRSAPPLLSRS